MIDLFSNLSVDAYKWFGLLTAVSGMVVIVVGVLLAVEAPSLLVEYTYTTDGYSYSITYVTRFLILPISRDSAKGKRFQRLGEDFRRMSVMRLEKSNEVQMINCPISGVNDRGRMKRLIRFLWMMTGDCVQLTDDCGLYIEATEDYDAIADEMDEET